MGIFGNSNNQPAPAVDPSAASPAPDPQQGNIDGVLPTSGDQPVAPYGPQSAPTLDTPVDDTSSQYIVTGPAPQPADNTASPAYNPHVGAPVSQDDSAQSPLPAADEVAQEYDQPEPTTPPAEPVSTEAEEPQPVEEPTPTPGITPAYPEEAMPAPAETPAEPAAEVAPDEVAAEAPIEEEAPAEAIPVTVNPAPESLETPDPVTPLPSPSTSTDGQDLSSIKQQALQQLSPLVTHLNQTPEERFNTAMMMLQATDDQLLVAVAYEAAQAITDEKIRAQALLDIVNEINYFTQKAA